MGPSQIDDRGRRAGEADDGEEDVFPERAAAREDDLIAGLDGPRGPLVERAAEIDLVFLPAAEEQHLAEVSEFRWAAGGRKGLADARFARQVVETRLADFAGDGDVEQRDHDDL